MKNQPLVSIIIPFYNTGLSLEGLLKQVLVVAPKAIRKFKKNYNPGDLEIICIDDNSTDDSLSRIEKFAKKEKAVKLIHQEKNHGSAAARNRGLKEAKGDFYFFLDSDDFVNDSFFSQLLMPLKDDNTALSLCGFRQIFLKDGKAVDKFTNAMRNRSEKEGLREYILQLMLADGRLYSSVNKAYRGDIIRKFKVKFDEKLDFAEDTKFVLDYLKCFDDEVEIKHIAEPLYFYNYGTKTSVVSQSSLEWKNWQKSYEDVIAWLGQEADGSERVIPRKEYKLAKHLKTRFKLSHSFAVARSKMDFKQKREYLSLPRLILAQIIVKIRG